MRRNPWVALPTLLLSLDVSVLYLALPKLSADLHADATEQLWILDIYSFMLAGFLVTMGALGDRIGRPPAAAHRGRRVRGGLDRRRLRHQPGDAHRGPAAARAAPGPR